MDCSRESDGLHCLIVAVAIVEAGDLFSENQFLKYQISFLEQQAKELQARCFVLGWRGRTLGEQICKEQKTTQGLREENKYLRGRLFSLEPFLSTNLRGPFGL